MISASLFVHKADVSALCELERPGTTTLSLSAAEFKTLGWTEENEFLYKNQHYDLSALRKQGDVYILSCLADQKEDQLFSNLDKVIGKHAVKKITFSRMVYLPFRSVAEAPLHYSDFIYPGSVLLWWNDAPRSITIPPPRFLS